MKARRLIRTLGFLFLLLISPLWVFSQVTVRGLVTDDSNEALIGVNVVEVGTSNGVVTNINGNFEIKVNNENASLKFTYIGYEPQILTVKDKKTIKVVLKPKVVNLNEVVVVGYGKMKRSDLTGSISTVKGDIAEKSVVTSADQMLQGKAAGIQVTQNSGIPGGSSSIRIRGVNSINGSNEPIYVVDGVIINGESSSDDTNPLSSINPSDIESMDILKDASATAIYGARAANGVIIITTKRGKSGESTIKYNTYVGWQEMPKKIALLNLQQYAELKNTRANLGLIYADDRFVRTDLLGEGTDWQDELFSKALMNNHNLSITGGSDNTTYAIGAGYLNQKGIAAGSGFDRFSLKANIDTQVKKWLKAGVDLGISNTKQTLTVSDESLIKIAWKQTPDVAVKAADGTWSGPETSEYVQTNPLALAMISTNNKEYTGARGNTYLAATILKGLNFKTEFSFDYGMNNTYKFTPTYTFGTISNTEAVSEQSKSYSRYWSFRNMLNYDRTFNKIHNVNLMLGQEAEKSTWEYLYGYRSGYLSNNATDLTLGDASTAKNSGSSGGHTIMSQFGRLFYSYDNKYLLTSTLRHDGSSYFAEGHQWGWFPSAAFAWRISNENFLKDNKIINNLKLRLGWGQVGNENVGAEYAYTSALTSVQTATWGTGLLASNTANPELTWETTTSSNVGLDLSLYSGRLDFTLDLYYKRTDNLLLQVPLPAYVGTSSSTQGAASSPYANVGSLSNKGIEFSINTVNIDKKNFNWNTTIVFSSNKNTVLSLNTESGVVDGTISEGSESDYVVTRTAVGQSVGEFYGYKIIGRFEKASDFYYYDDDGNVQQVALPSGISIGENGAWIGDYIIEDVNGDGVITSADRTYLGSPLPKFTYGITNSFSYKNLDFSFALTGVYGNKVVNYQRRWLEDASSNTNLFASALGYAVISKIDESGPDDDYRNLYISGGNSKMSRITTGSYNDWNNYFSDRFIENGSYLRIQSISIGYNFPKSIIAKTFIQNLKIYANLQNVYTFSVYSGYDPEIGSTNQSALLTGIDNARYPSPRVYTFGLNLNL